MDNIFGKKSDNNQDSSDNGTISEEEVKDYLNKKVEEQKTEESQAPVPGPTPLPSASPAPETQPSPVPAGPPAGPPAALEPQTPKPPTEPPKPVPSKPESPKPEPPTPSGPPEIKPISVREEFKPPTLAKPQPEEAPGEEASAEEKASEKSKASPSSQTGVTTSSETNNLELEADHKPKKSKWKGFCLGFGILFLLLAAGAGAWYYFLASGTLILNITPEDALIEINSQIFKAGETAKMRPGIYQIKVSKSDYVNYEGEFNIARLKQTSLDIGLKKVPSLARIADGSEIFDIVENNLLFLNNPGNTIFKVELDKLKNSQAEKKAITPGNLAQIKEIIWSPDGSLAIFKITQDQAKLKNTPFAKSGIKDGTIMTWLYDFKRYDLVNQEAFFWGAEIGDVAWSPESDRVYYIYQPASGERSLISASKTNQNLERLLNLKKANIIDPEITISDDGKFLALVSRSTQYQTNNLYLFEILTKDLKKLTKDGEVLEARISPDSSKILYSQYQDNRQEAGEFSRLKIINSDGTGQKDLGIFTFLDKVSWTSDSKSLMAAAWQVRDAADVFYKINLENGKDEYLIKDEKVIKPKRVKFSEAQKMAFMSINNVIYYLDLISSNY